MTLITDNMKDLNEKLHVTRGNYGTAARKHAHTMYERFLLPNDIKRVLDYGCGKNKLQGVLAKINKEFVSVPFDPCMPQYSNRPNEQFKGVICHDVLEHVEYETIDNVLDDIYNYGLEWFFFSIGLGPGYKTLADGRDNHLIQKPSAWWKELLTKHNYEIVETLETEERPVNPKVPLYVIICKKVSK